MRTIILSLFSRSFSLLAPTAKEQGIVVGKDGFCNFQIIQVLNKNPLYLIEYRNKQLGPVSQNRVKWEHLLIDGAADSLNSRLVFKDWTPILHLIAK
ncbi:hypothetical protein [Sphingobacterium puteale]|uniref:hypothetical protein n=1 Tax=Sphingobacterium puteale TaxID=2420510 RepID=UPI003D95BC6F